jgi:hypothetical protein
MDNPLDYPLQYPWSIHGLSMECTWIILWIIHGLSMEHPWSIHGVFDRVEEREVIISFLNLCECVVIEPICV